MINKRSEPAYDVVIVGSGAGGGSLAWALARRGHKVLLLEQGDRLPAESDNATDAGAFGNKYFSTETMEICGNTCEFPVHAYVGGQTKLYGAALYRFRERDFTEVQYPDGVSPPWPIDYAALEPYYSEAEQLYRVHGSTDRDPSEPPHSSPYPYGPIADEPAVEVLTDRLRRQGLHVSPIPRALDLREQGNCVFCSTCDAYACPTHGKMDTEIACIKPALETGNLTIWTRSQCVRVLTRSQGDLVDRLEIRRSGNTTHVEARLYVISCGTLHSPALLMRSANKQHPRGLANSSGLLGRYLSGHNASFFFIPTLTRLSGIHQKTFAVNDYYLGETGAGYPLGTLQAAGRMPVWFHTEKWQSPVVKFLHAHSYTCFIMSEIWPMSDNRISLDSDGRIRVSFMPNNVRVFRRLRSIYMRSLRKAGYLATMSSRHPGIGVPWHPVGTARFGHDAGESVLNQWCQTHDISNLFVVDSSFLPSAGSLNTTLTVIAQALRVAEHIDLRLTSG